MNPQDQEFLTNCFASSIRDLEDLLGWNGFVAQIG